MPGRKRAASGKKSAPTPPKLKKTESQVVFDTAVGSLKKAAKARRKTKKTHAIDKQCRFTGNPLASVFEDYNCMLNQTNIGQNNNKFYVIQIISHGSQPQYTTFTRWGRVGEVGQSAELGTFSDKDKAIKLFKKKFTDKTRNAWENRSKFRPSPGKYTLLDMAGEEEDDEEPSALVAVPVRATGAKTKLQSRLDQATQNLVSLIFDTDMFNDQLKNFKIDVKKMPLGKLSKGQIGKGFACLEEIGKAIKDGLSRGILAQLSSKFYTLIPHDFGRTVPPVIMTAEGVREKMDMLLVLGDIEVAQSMQKQKSAKGEADEHPADKKYGLLDCELSRVDPKGDEFNMLKKYVDSTHGRGNLLNIWKVNRKAEAQRFETHKTMKNRKLLWHGTNIAVVAAILKSGLRIMPHSGGRLGKGIYFASEQAKSAAYVSPANSGRFVMFLNEVALGDEYSHLTGDSMLIEPPKGYQSIVGRGQREPDPQQDRKMKFDGRDVVIPQGRPVPVVKWRGTNFFQSEYLIYKESQCRIRYLLEFTMR